MERLFGNPAYKRFVLQDHKKLEKMVQACFDSDDYKEGRRAFMQKRPPQFKGL